VLESAIANGVRVTEWRDYSGSALRELVDVIGSGATLVPRIFIRGYRV
jgi:hypothetical protein